MTTDPPAKEPPASISPSPHGVQNADLTTEPSTCVAWFRTAAPYIRVHRDGIFVVFIGASATSGPSLAGLLQDAAVLATLGIRMVLVYDLAWSVNQATSPCDSPRAESQPDPPLLRATHPEAMADALNAAGRLRFNVEAQLSRALAKVPLTTHPVRAVSGNFVYARPAGIHAGQDLELTGEVRRIDAKGIHQCLEAGHLVVIPPIGYSPSGELFRLVGASLAARIAIDLHASKLIALEDGLRLQHGDGTDVRELTLHQARAVLPDRRAKGVSFGLPEALLETFAHACRHGVRRAHLLDASIDGALALELLSRDGVGTMVAADVYDETRRATSDDLGGIVELIDPLERSGVLVRRSRDKLEHEIGHFLVMERDGTVIACAAVYPIADDHPPRDAQAHGFVELACVAVHPGYRNSDRVDALLRRAEQEARILGAKSLLVLTTQASHWFLERGFESRRLEELPAARRSTYNMQRGSRVLVKTLE